MSGHPRSVITCDMEGRIETFNRGAEEMFGYRAGEVVGKKRVSLFSPGTVVLGHLGKWLQRARKEGAFRTRTVFLHRNGTPLAAEIRITPTYRGGRQIGYCGVTTPLEGVDPSRLMPEIGPGTRMLKWIVITRAPFLTASVVPVLIGLTWTLWSRPGLPLRPALFAAALVGAVALHVAANVFNDYFDWESGTDPANADYVTPLCGGSRAVEMGLATQRKMWRTAWAAAGVALLAGAALIASGRPWVAAFGLFGALAGYFYTAPPLRLAARRGLGELLVGLSFGVGIVAGTAYALSGTVVAADFVAGIPIGLFTTAILYINQFPDAEADGKTGKRHLVVVLGKKNARWGYPLIVGGAYAVLGTAAAGRIFPPAALAACFTLPLAARCTRTLLSRYADRGIVPAMKGTIQLHLLTGLLLAAGLWWGAA